MNDKLRTGLVGLGAMGGRIAESLIAAGHEVVGFDISPAVCARAKALGVGIAASPAAVAAACRTTIACVTGAEAVQAAVLGPDGLAQGQLKGDVFIDCTTVTVACSRTFTDAFAEKRVTYLDAPLSRFPPDAVALVGGTDEGVAAATPTLSTFAKWICHLGPNGAGALGKLLSQYATYSTFAAAVHALREARRNGLAIPAFATALRNGSAASVVLEGAIAGLIDDGRDWGRIRIIQKDLSYIQDHADNDPQLDLPLLQSVEDLFLKIPDELLDAPISRLVTATEKVRED